MQKRPSPSPSYQISHLSLKALSQFIIKFNDFNKGYAVYYNLKQSFFAKLIYFFIIIHLIFSPQKVSLLNNLVPH